MGYFIVNQGAHKSLKKLEMRYCMSHLQNSVAQTPEFLTEGTLSAGIGVI
jgi:hypothetical protein